MINVISPWYCFIEDENVGHIELSNELQIYAVTYISWNFYLWSKYMQLSF